MILQIHTFLGDTEQAGSPSRMRDGGGYQSVAELQCEMHRRWKSTYVVTDIEDGVEIVPTPQHARFCGHSKQIIRLLNE